MDKIIMQGMRFMACHGVLDFEHHQPQPFIIDAVLELDLWMAGRNDNLGHTVSYDTAYHTIMDIVTGDHIDLLETLAARVADGLLTAYPAVGKVQVTVKKPQAPVDGEFDYFAVNLDRVRTKRCYIGLGSNQGSRQDYLRSAVSLVNQIPDTRVETVSPIYETAPWGKLDQPAFLNQVIAVDTALDPFTLLSQLLSIEQVLGRIRVEKWGPRTIDLDLLWYEDFEINTERLTLPHPLLEERLFVLYPLADLHPDLIIAGGRSVSEVLQRQLLKEGNSAINRL
ncbi:MAG: 2-amino-4-hydroxy-6-hydroxymethyldihydropteridine diphosphokinase [Methylocystaceae bacterium]